MEKFFPGHKTNIQTLAGRPTKDGSLESPAEITTLIVPLVDRDEHFQWPQQLHALLHAVVRRFPRLAGDGLGGRSLASEWDTRTRKIRPIQHGIYLEPGSGNVEP